MCGCESLPASEASVMNSFLNKLRFSTSVSESGNTTLMATSRLAKGSWHRYTSLVAPSPSLLTTWYLPIFSMARLSQGFARALDCGAHALGRGAAGVVAAGERTLESQYLEYVGADERRELPHFGQAEGGAIVTARG